MRILVVDNDLVFCRWLEERLYAYGHVCQLIHSGVQALNAIQHYIYDVIILDRMLPGMDGLTVLRKLQNCRHPPIMLLSAIEYDMDRVEALELGAEDYLGKPCDFDELRLRLDNLVGREMRNTAQNTVLILADLKVDCFQRNVWRSGKPVSLTNKELKLLLILMETPGKVISREYILERVWGYNFIPRTNLIDVHMCKLRAKIDKGFDSPLIRTLRTVGYYLKL